MTDIQEKTPVDARIMGKIIGTITGWDQQDTLAMILYDLCPNEIGRQFVPDFVEGDLGINFDHGLAEIYDDDGAVTILRTDWSVFNQDL